MTDDLRMLDELEALVASDEPIEVHHAAKVLSRLPTLLRLARRGLEAGEVVEEIAETCENLQRAAMLNVGDYIHVQGLRGGVEKIKAMADAALSRLAAKEER